MTKRFIPIFDRTDKRVVGAKDNGKIISFMDVFDKLNELNDKCANYRQALIDLGINVDILDGVCDD